MDSVPLDEITSVQTDVEIFLIALKAEVQKPKPYAWDKYEKFATAYRQFHETFEGWKDDVNYFKFQKAINHFNETLFSAEDILFKLLLKTPYRVW